MKSLTFTNAQGKQILFSKESEYRWLDITGIGGGTISFQTSSNPFQDGSSSLDDGFFESKLFAVRFAMRASNKDALFRNLNNIVNPRLGAGTLKYFDGVKSLMLSPVKLRAMPEYEKGTPDIMYSSLVFEAFDPLYKDSIETEEYVVSQTDLFTFPLQITEEFIFDASAAGGKSIIKNKGDVQTPVYIEIEGPLTSPIVLGNKTTSKNIVISTAIGENEVLIIDTDLSAIDVRKRNTLTGLEESAFQYLDINQTEFWTLEVGDNIILFTHGAEVAEGATLKYRNRYVGV